MATELQWTVGFINASAKYLTAESFQYKVNANALSLRKKQIWTLERIDDQAVAIKSCFGRYLGTDRDGKICADCEEIGDDNKWLLISQNDGTVEIRNIAHERCLGGSGDNVRALNKETPFWTVQLAMSPQINLRSVIRKTYAHLSDDATEIRVNEEMAWGYDATITLEFYGGKYAIRAANAKYLSHTGNLDDKVSKNSLFILIFRGTQVAFQDRNGRYLTAVGAHATLQSRKDNITKDELFTIEDTNPQVTLIAYNRKYVSVRMGQQEVRANQAEITDNEIFQLEAVDRCDMSGQVKWMIRSKNKRYWNSSDNLLSDAEDGSSEECQFSIEWMGPMVCFKASNGKYISVKSNGQLSASSRSANDSCKFVLELVNHPIITLRGENGFVGVKGQSNILECNRSQYDIFRMKGNAGTYTFKAANGKFWDLEKDGSIVVNGETPLDFFVEIRAHTRLCVLCPNGQYIEGAQNGSFTATGGTAVSMHTLWEY